MSKALRYALYFLLCCVLLHACGIINLHDHEWQEATCITPRTCAICGDTDGEPLGHQWAEATCTTPKTCIVCGETNGSPAKHSWIARTCEMPKTCSVCGMQEGEPCGHLFNSATWVATVKPTCQSEGVLSNTCMRVSCGATVTKTAPSLTVAPEAGR